VLGRLLTSIESDSKRFGSVSDLISGLISILQKRDGEGFLRCWDVRGGAGNLACPDFTCFHFIDATPCNKKSISHFREGFKGAVLAKMALQRRPVSPENW
jgi:hypothetical protein